MAFLRIKGFHQPHMLLYLAAGVIGVTWGNHACADWKPARTVELISSAAPGSGPDVTARIIQTIWRAKRIVGVPVSVVNKSGGNYSAAWIYLNQHGGDGHYLLMASLGLLTGNVPGADRAALADASVIAQLFTEYMVVAVRADSSLKTGRDLARRLKKDPGALSIAVGGGTGGVNHLAIATAMQAAGVNIKKLKLIAFNSSAEAAVAVLGGHVDIVAATATAVLHAGTDGLRVLAISAPRRVAGTLASVPTWREQGIDAVFDNFRFVLGPNGMRREQIAYWESVFDSLSASDEWKSNLLANHWTAAYLDGASAKRSLGARYAEMKTLLAGLGLAKD
jgi:putative tricarboxylic transport membrane protein